MIEFVGVVNFNKKGLTLNKSNSFNYLKSINNLDFQVEEIANNNVQFVYAIKTTDSTQNYIFQNQNILTIIYGRCYTKINDSSFSVKKRFTAKEIYELYKINSTSFINKIKGSFAIFIYNQKEETLKIYTDPLNLLTVYYSSQKDGIVFSSSLNSLINVVSFNHLDLSINTKTVFEHITFGFNLDHDTFLNDSFEIPPGSELRYTNNKITIDKYFEHRKIFDVSTNMTTKNRVTEPLKQILTKNISLYNNGPENTAVALTGGLDSRTILALLDDKFDKYQYFSYGKEGSWDIEIPNRIAKKLKLNYTPFFLEDKYENNFSNSANLAVILSSGSAQFTHANISFIYEKYLKGKNSILTGLFGSELIKTPSSRGLFIDENILRLLNSSDIKSEAHKILINYQFNSLGLEFEEDEIIESIYNNPVINNKLPANEKVFYFILMTGIRKYFKKEISIQRYWVDNLHPYLDVEFIVELLNTSFPWVYNYSQNKNLAKNLSIHKLYSNLISNKPILNSIISTHGFKPKYLLETYYYPFLAIEYFKFKKRIKSASHLNFQSEFSINHIHKTKKEILMESNLNKDYITEMMQTNKKSFINLLSLQYWFIKSGLSL